MYSRRSCSTGSLIATSSISLGQELSEPLAEARGDLLDVLVGHGRLGPMVLVDPVGDLSGGRLLVVQHVQLDHRGMSGAELTHRLVDGAARVDPLQVGVVLAVIDELDAAGLVAPVVVGDAAGD